MFLSDVKPFGLFQTHSGVIFKKRLLSKRGSKKQKFDILRIDTGVVYTLDDFKNTAIIDLRFAKKEPKL